MTAKSQITTPVVVDHDPIERLAGMFTGMYPKGYLDKLRGEWRA